MDNRDSVKFAENSNSKNLPPIEENADYFFSQASNSLKKNNLNKAIADWTKVIAFQANHLPSLFNRGNAYFIQGEIDKAERDFVTILKFSQTYAKAYLGLGNCYYVLGYFDEAYENYLKYMVLVQDNEIPHPDIITIFEKLRDIVGA